MKRGSGKAVGRRAAAMIIVFALALGGCSTTLNPDGSLVSGAVVDRFKIGDRADCPDQDDPTCDGSLRLATEVVTGQRGIEADSIVGHRFYYESVPAGTTLGGPPVTVVVFDVADGSRVAVGAYCGVGPCQVVRR